MHNEEGQFDPSQYNKIEDMPKYMQHRFREVDDGFVRSTDKDPRNIVYYAEQLKAEAELTEPEAVRKMNELLRENDSRIFAAQEKVTQLVDERMKIGVEISNIRQAIEMPLRKWSAQQLRLIGHEGYLMQRSDNSMKGVIDRRNIEIYPDGRAFLEDRETGARHDLAKGFTKRFLAKYQHCAYSTESVDSATDAATVELRTAYNQLCQSESATHNVFHETRAAVIKEEDGALRAMTPMRDAIEERVIIGNLLDQQASR